MSSVKNDNNNNINNNNDDDDNNHNNIQKLCWTVYMQECMMESAKKGERTGKRPCVNEISFLLALFSGYTILNHE